MQMQNFEKHVWAEIDLDALRANFRTVKQRAGSLPLCAVVKADSYGHGAVQCARVFAQEGASWLAVSCLAEALQLRRSGQTLPILILGHVQPTYAAALIRDDITAACYSLPQAQALSEAAQAAGGRVKVHLAVDTGMGRIGFALRTDFDAAIAEAIAACTLPGLEMTGLFQHFSVADDTAEENIAYTAEQHRLFVQACSALTAAGHKPGIVHCDNSAGVMLHPDERPTPVATLCTGYPDGYPRQLSCGKGIVEIHGTPCPVLGRVCMDQMMVDLSAVPGTVQEGDEAILWGGTVSDSAEDIARKTDTITYEVLCGVSRRVPRVYLEHGTTAAVEDWILND